MWRTSLARLTAVVAVVAPLMLTACNPDKLSSATSGGELGEFVVTASVVGTPVATLVVTVTSADIPIPLVFNLTVQNGTATGTIKLPPGLARLITVEAFDSNGDITHEGHKTIDVRPGQNPPVSIPMVAKAGKVDITVVLGAVSLVVTPAELTTYVDGTAPLTAVITAPNGDVLTDSPEWATNNPTVATVDQAGNVSGVREGTVDIVATYAGIAAISHVTVQPACVGCNWVTARVQLYSPPFKGDFQGLWGTGATNVYGVTSYGDILRYNGNSWSVVLSIAGGFTSISGTSISDIWAAGGTPYHFDGSTWSPKAPTPYPVSSVFTTAIGTPPGTTVTYTGSYDGRIFKWSGTDWTTDYSGGMDASLYAMWGSSASDIFAAGNNGVIVHYDGNAWLPMVSGTTNFINSIWGSGSTDVYAAAGPTLLHYNGISWSTASPAPSTYAYTVTGSSANDVYVAGIRTLFHFDGATWTQVDPPSWWPQASAIWGGTATGVILAGYPGGSVVYRNGAFTRLSLNPRMNGVTVVSKSLAFANGSDGLVYKFNGASWSVLYGPDMTLFTYDIWAADANNVFTVACSQVRHFDGAVWTSQFVPAGGCLFNISGTSASNVFAVGSGGAIARYDGTSWSAMSSGVTSQLNGVWGSGPADVYAVGEEGTVLHYDGISWSPVGTPFSPSANISSVSGTSAHDVFIVGYDNAAPGYRVIHFDGTNWNSLPIPYGQIYSVFASRSADVYATGYAYDIGSYAIFRWDGSTWQTKATSASYLARVSGLRGVDVFAVGENGTIMRGNAPIGASLLASATANMRVPAPKPGVLPWRDAPRSADQFSQQPRMRR